MKGGDTPNADLRPSIDSINQGGNIDIPVMSFKPFIEGLGRGLKKKPVSRTKKRKNRK